MASATGLESFSVEEDAIYSANFDAIDRIVRRQSSCADKAKDMHKLEGFQKVFAKQKMDLHTPDRGKGVLGRPDRNPEDFQQKATKTHFPSRSLSPSCTFSAAVMLLRKRKSESHVIAHDVYHPHIKDCGEGKAKICASSISPTLKQGEDVRQGGFSFSYTSQSPAPDENMQKEGLSDVSDACLANSPFFLRQHAPEYETLYEPVLKPILHLGTESQPRRRSKSKSTLPHCSDLEKNKIASSTDAKKRTKEKLNWEDWHILKEAGTSWRSGVRRSTRIRSRPLEFWRGERFLYGRIHNCLSTIVGIKYISPEKAIPRKDSTAEFKVQSYVDDKYTDIVKFAALH